MKPFTRTRHEKEKQEKPIFVINPGFPGHDPQKNLLLLAWIDASEEKK